MPTWLVPVWLNLGSSALDGLGSGIVLRLRKEAGRDGWACQGGVGAGEAPFSCRRF